MKHTHQVHLYSATDIQEKETMLNQKPKQNKCSWCMCFTFILFFLI